MKQGKAISENKIKENMKKEIIKAIKNRSKENKKYNADDSWQYAYADAIEVIKMIK